MCIRNEILKDIRKSNKYKNDISLENIISEDENLTLMDTIQDDFNMEEKVIENEERNKLYKAISRLNEHEQKIIKLYYYDGLSQAEIGIKISRQQSIVSRQLKKVIVKLRKYMSDSYIEETKPKKEEMTWTITPLR